MRAIYRPPSALSVAGAVLALACGSGGGGKPPPGTYAVSGAITGAATVTVALSGSATATTTTDGAGAYSFTGLANGTYTLTPSKAGYVFAPANRTVVVSGADVSGQGFAATAVHSVAGTVSGAAGVTVSLLGHRSATTTTGASGAYSFADLPDGAYTVTPSRTGYTFAPVSRTVTVSGADVTGQDFAASPVVIGARTVSGLVTGTTVEGVTVTLRSEPAGATIAAAATDATGTYSFGSLPDGSYSVTPSLLEASVTFHAFSPPRRQVTVAGADVVVPSFAGTPLGSFEDFASGAISAARWDSGQHFAYQEAQQAVLGSAVDAPAANTSYGSSLVVVPGAVAGRTTSVSAGVQLVGAGSSLIGDAVGRAGIDLLFQPLADRVASPDNRTNALFVRVALQASAAGLVALRQAFECTNPDCTATHNLGTVVSGGAAWPAAGLGSIAADTPYTLSIAFDTAQSRFTFSLQGGAHTTPVATTLDLSAVAPRLAAAEHFQTRLLTQVRGGAQGGAGSGGSVVALLDDVAIGVNGQAAAAFDDFSAGTMLDPARWTTGGSSAQLASGSLEVRLWQQGSPEVTGLNLSRDLVPPSSALQARVTVLDYASTGTGQVGARLAAAIYNDGSSGLGTAPDVNGVSSQVGDVIAQLSVTDTDVSYAVVRCNVAVCTGPKAIGTGHDFVVQRTSLRTSALGNMHLLFLHWDAATHLLVFQVDGLPAAVVDPTQGSGGVPVASGPHREFWQVGNHATAAAPGLDFGSGSSAYIHSRYQMVKRL